jgi:hypothetical protein
LTKSWWNWNTPPCPASGYRTSWLYAHVDKLVDRGLLTVDELGLAVPRPASVVELAPRAG